MRKRKAQKYKALRTYGLECDPKSGAWSPCEVGKSYNARPIGDYGQTNSANNVDDWKAAVSPACGNNVTTAQMGTVVVAEVGHLRKSSGNFRA
ncbi:hypothetical protein M8J75_003970 [Diaphorina citri]|nr:hypothetical protein M8J75_003970 [Diaphorina citri]